MRHTQKQESIAHSKKKDKLTETAHEESHTRDLLDKDFSSTVLNLLKKLKKTKDKELKETRTMRTLKIENINKEMKL